MGINVSEQSFLETPATTTEFTRQRYDGARQRRDRSSQGLSDSSAYQAENEAARQLRGPPPRQRSRSARTLRGGANSGTASSPTREAVVAAELAGRNRRDEVRRRSERAAAATERARQSAAATAEEDDEEGDDDDDEEEDEPHTRGRSDAADALYNSRMGTVKRECFRHWHKLTIKRVVRHQYFQANVVALEPQRVGKNTNQLAGGTMVCSRSKPG